MSTTISYTPPPTCAKFMQSAAFTRFILGPVGSGKTTACIMELFRRACEQAPAPDGFRYTRFAIVRTTLQQLRDTVLKDLLAWFGPIAQYKVSLSSIFFEAGDVRSEWILIPLEDPEDQRRLLSMQLTAAMMSEFTEMEVELLSPLVGRCGRYPSAQQGGCSWFGIIGDGNFPSEGSDWYGFMENDLPPDAQIFKQPGGMTPEAENLQWLHQTSETLKLPEDDPRRLAQGRTYYERFIRSNTPDWCKRYVHAQYGPDPSGAAVFGSIFNSSFHAVDSLEPLQAQVLLIGQDFGRDPCSIICQLSPRGNLFVLEEILAEDIGLELHVASGLRPRLMDPRYMGKRVVIIGDPAGRAKDSLYEETSFDLLKRMGFMCFPAPTNDLEPRIQAVENFLMGQRDGKAAIIFDRSRCPTLVRAMNGEYRYSKTKQGQRKPRPDKNKYSHVSDALQYVCLAAQAGAHGGMVPRFIMPHMARSAAEPPMPPGGWT